MKKYYILALCLLYITTLHSSFSYAKDTDILELFSLPPSTLQHEPTSSGKNTTVHGVTTRSYSKETSPIVEKSTSSENSDINISPVQIYIGIKGGVAGVGMYQPAEELIDSRIGASFHIPAGAIIGIAFQPSPTFAFRFGLSIEKFFLTKQTSYSLDTDGLIGGIIGGATGGGTITPGGAIAGAVGKKEHIFEKTTILGEIYFDFKSDSGSAFFLKFAGGYSLVTLDNKKDNGATGAFGMGFRWYPHKYVSIDWTMIDIRGTIAENISLDAGTLVGLTFQY